MLEMSDWNITASNWRRITSRAWWESTYIEKYILELVMVILSPSSNREIIILELYSHKKMD